MCDAPVTSSHRSDPFGSAIPGTNAAPDAALALLKDFHRRASRPVWDKAGIRLGVKPRSLAHEVGLDSGEPGSVSDWAENPTCDESRTSVVEWQLQVRPGARVFAERTQFVQSGGCSARRPAILEELSARPRTWVAGSPKSTAASIGASDAVIGAQRLVAPAQVRLGIAIEVAERRRQAIAAMLFRHTAWRPPRVLQTFGQYHEALAAEHHMSMLEARERRSEVVKAVLERLARDGDADDADPLGKTRSPGVSLTAVGLCPPLPGAF